MPGRDRSCLRQDKYGERLNWGGRGAVAGNLAGRTRSTGALKTGVRRTAFIVGRLGKLALVMMQLHHQKKMELQQPCKQGEQHSRQVAGRCAEAVINTEFMFIRKVDYSKKTCFTPRRNCMTLSRMPSLARSARLGGGRVGFADPRQDVLRANLCQMEKV